MSVAVFSLARNKPELVERARAIGRDLREHGLRTQYDEGNIGQLYRRQDEIGTPFCVTVDCHDTLGGRIGHRAQPPDSMAQERIGAETLWDYLSDRLSSN